MLSSKYNNKLTNHNLNIKKLSIVAHSNLDKINTQDNEFKALTAFEILTNPKMYLSTKQKEDIKNN